MYTCESTKYQLEVGLRGSVSIHDVQSRAVQQVESAKQKQTRPQINRKTWLDLATTQIVVARSNA